MAADQQQQQQEEQEDDEDEVKKNTKLISSYLGLSFSVLLAFLPKNSISLVSDLQSQIGELSWKLQQAEDQIKQMKSRRKEDSKANARVVEIFAGHRNAWHAEEKRLLQQLDEAAEEIAHLRAKISHLEKEEAESKVRIQDLELEAGERDHFMISFMSAAPSCGGGPDHQRHPFGEEREPEMLETLNNVVSDGNGFNSDFLASSASKFWAERGSLWQDVHNESVEPMYDMKHFVARRESPWKIDGGSSGVPSKLKLLEEELLNLEKVGKSDLLKVPSSMRKQVKRYQALTGKIDDLCRRMDSDPCEPTFSAEFRTQMQTEFLLEAFRLQQRASETGQKLMALHTEIGKNYYREELGSEAKHTTKRSLDSIRNNLKEIQRNLEIWLARIIGDLEGILARDGASHVREYYNPFVQ